MKKSEIKEALAAGKRILAKRAVNRFETETKWQQWFISPRGVACCNGFVMVELYEETAGDVITALLEAGAVQDLNICEASYHVYDTLNNQPAGGRPLELEPAPPAVDLLTDVKAFGKARGKKEARAAFGTGWHWGGYTYLLPCEHASGPVTVNSLFLESVLTLLGAGNAPVLELDPGRLYCPLYLHSDRGRAVIMPVRNNGNPDLQACTLDGITAFLESLERKAPEAA